MPGIYEISTNYLHLIVLIFQLFYLYCITLLSVVIILAVNLELSKLANTENINHFIWHIYTSLYICTYSNPISQQRKISHFKKQTKLLFIIHEIPTK